VRHELPTPEQLANSPQLAALHVLQGVLEAVQRALLTEHPSLEQVDFLAEAPSLNADDYLADVILCGAAQLETAITRYRHLLAVHEQQELARFDHVDF
jgi:hypothetical protein